MNRTAVKGGILVLILTAVAYLVFVHVMPPLINRVLAAAWAQLPAAEARTEWRTAYVWIAIGFAGGSLVGALALWFYGLRAGVRRQLSDEVAPNGRTALARLRQTNNSELRGEVVTEVIESIVAGRPNHKVLCRQILQTLVSGERNILKLVEWGDCGLTTYGRQNLIRDLRSTLVDDLRDAAIPALRQLEEKLRNTREAVGNTHRRLSGRGFGGTAPGHTLAIEPEDRNAG